MFRRGSGRAARTEDLAKAWRPPRFREDLYSGGHGHACGRGPSSVAGEQRRSVDSNVSRTGIADHPRGTQEDRAHMQRREQPERSGSHRSRSVRPREGMRMSLKGAKVEKFRQRLLAKRKELLSGVHGSNVKSLESTSDEIQDIADQASNAYTKEFLLSIGDTERRMLKQVDEALHKIRQDTYGLCEACGELISERRLEALPFARLCIACQEEEERAKAEK